jgi:hypothetical protein
MDLYNVSSSPDLKILHVCFDHPRKLTYLYQKFNFMAISRRLASDLADMLSLQITRVRMETPRKN